MTAQLVEMASIANDAPPLEPVLPFGHGCLDGADDVEEDYVDDGDDPSEWKEVKLKKVSQI